jgi:hypothetical protein
VSRSGGENDKIVSFVTAFCHYGCTHEMDETGSKLSCTSLPGSCSVNFSSSKVSNPDL